MDWVSNALEYLSRIDDLSHNIKQTLKTCNNSNITKATRQDIHDLEQSVYGLTYALNKIEMLDFAAWERAIKNPSSVLTDEVLSQ